MAIAFLSPVYENSFRNDILTITSLHSWFIKFYFILLFVSPILEWVISKLGREYLLIFFIVLTVLNVVGCWGFEIIHDNRQGYSVLNFIYMYFMGRTLRDYSSSRLVVCLQKYGLVLVIVIAVTSGFVFESLNSGGSIVESGKFWAYNGPLVLTLAMLIFLYFSSLDFSNMKVNHVAACTLVVYLSHSNLVVGYYRNLMTDAITDKTGLLCGLIISAILVYIIGTLVGFGVVTVQKHIMRLFYKSN